MHQSVLFHGRAVWVSILNTLMQSALCSSTAHFKQPWHFTTWENSCCYGSGRLQPESVGEGSQTSFADLKVRTSGDLDHRYASVALKVKFSFNLLFAQEHEVWTKRKAPHTPLIWQHIMTCLFCKSWKATCLLYKLESNQVHPCNAINNI